MEINREKLEVPSNEQEKGGGKRTVEEETLPSVHLKGEQDSSRWARLGRASQSPR